MTWPDDTLATLRRLDHAEQVLKGLFAGRDEAVDLLLLAAVAQEHLLLLGPPGTAKTELLRRFTRMIDARGFHYLLSRFTEPTEIFGPLDLEVFRAGRYEVNTAGMLPEAEIAFLDEVFQGSSAILNSLLTLLHERIFYNGAERRQVPLITLVGASNSLPDDPWLKAFSDRFALRLEVESLDDDLLDDLLDLGWQSERSLIDARRRVEAGEDAAEIPELRAEELRVLHARLPEVDLDAVRPIYAAVVRELRAEGVELSDRRIVKGLKLIAAAALRRRAGTADARDFWPLRHVWTLPEDAEVLRGVIDPRIVEAGGAASEDARTSQEILLDLAVLAGREDALRSEASFSAHLTALNRLRREALAGRPDDDELHHRVDEAIESVLRRLEALQNEAVGAARV